MVYCTLCTCTLPGDQFQPIFIVFKWFSGEASAVQAVPDGEVMRPVIGWWWSKDAPHWHPSSSIRGEKLNVIHAVLYLQIHFVIKFWFLWMIGTVRKTLCKVRPPFASFRVKFMSKNDKSIADYYIHLSAENKFTIWFLPVTYKNIFSMKKYS
jgi:hypothetical protein